jgi:hypothetical protein
MERESNTLGPAGAISTSADAIAHPALIFSLVLLSWLGAYFHTWTELGLGLLRPENSLPALVGLGLFVGWWRSANSRRMWTWFLLAWTGGGHLIIGAVLSVLPLTVLPFTPDQSLAHYRSHLIYGLAQLPLIVLLVRSLLTDGRHRSDAGGHG